MTEQRMSYGMIARALSRTVLIAPLLWVLSGCADPEEGLRTRCAALSHLVLEGVQISRAELQPARVSISGTGMPPLGEGMPSAPDIVGLPEFCRVVGNIRPEPGSDIRFEVWLPGNGWDGRLNGGNNAGLAGYIQYVDLAGAVRAGQAGVSTDTGHSADPMSGAWAKGERARIRDYGWRAIHLTTVAAKALVTAFYGRGPDRSYFIGCSNGGRQGLMAASRFPEDYDGIVAGAPLLMTDVALSMINTQQAQSPPGARIQAAQVAQLQAEAIRQCDALDGEQDGLLADPLLCRPDLSRLACGPTLTKGCFTAPQLAALQRIIDGPRSSAGERISFGFPPAGAESGGPLPILGWEGWITGFGARPPAQEVLTRELLAAFVAEPFASPETFDFDRHPALLREALGPDIDVQPDLRRFFDRGGKLILWQGWGDAVIPAALTLDYYQRVLRESGPEAAGSTRLFMIPGMQHCGGGPGFSIFGQASAPPPGASPQENVGAAIQAWVEKSRVPDSLTGRRAMVSPGAKPADVSRLHCAYPARAVRRDNGGEDTVPTYECRAP